MHAVRLSRKRLARYRAREDEWVEVRESRLLAEVLGLHGELGVFARRTIPKDTVVGIYYGPLYTSEEINALYGAGLAKYTLESSGDLKYCRDCAKAEESTKMRYINSNRGLGREPSVEFRDRDASRDFSVVAVRTIPAGDELFIDYGENYFDDGHEDDDSAEDGEDTEEDDTDEDDDDEESDAVETGPKDGAEDGAEDD